MKAILEQEMGFDALNHLSMSDWKLVTNAMDGFVGRDIKQVAKDLKLQLAEDVSEASHFKKTVILH